MIVTLFRSRLTPEAQDPAGTYKQDAQRLTGIAKTMPGYLSHKLYLAEDGERLMVVEFEDEQSLHAWSVHPDHVQAKKTGRQHYYAEYRVQICSVLRDRPFTRPAETAAGTHPRTTAG